VLAHFLESRNAAILGGLRADLITPTPATLRQASLATEESYDIANKQT